MSQRILQLDYLKGIMIVLVVMFHIVIFDNTYPTLRTAVYTFHVPVFLIISGYLAKTDRQPAAFSKVLLRLLIPYIVFETLYLLVLYAMGDVMHSTLAMNTLSLRDIIIRLVAYPLGVYWYLHALIVCNVVYYLVFHYLKLDIASKFILMALICYAITYVIKEVWWTPILAGSGFVWESIIYFLIGVFIKIMGNCMQCSDLQVGVTFLKLIPASPLSIIPLCILFSSTSYFYRGSLSGIAITLLVISFLLFVYNHLGLCVRNFWCYLGRNSLAVFVFAPFFIPLTKFAIPLFCFDNTVVLFTLFAIFVAIAGSLVCAWLSDRIHLSKFLFGKEEIYMAYCQ
jgi:fucose 4-O-acetylase-like acetyltransferase